MSLLRTTISNARGLIVPESTAAAPDPGPDPVADILDLNPMHFWLFDRTAYAATTLLYQDSAKTTPITEPGQDINAAVCLVDGQTWQATVRGPEWDGSKAFFDVSNSECFDVCSLSTTMTGDGPLWIATRHSIGGANQRLLGTSGAATSYINVLIGTASGGAFLVGLNPWLTVVGASFGVDERWITRLSDTPNGEVWRNGVSVATGDSGDSTRNLLDFTIGRNGPGSFARFLDGDLTAFVVFDYDLSAPQVAALDLALTQLGGAP